MSDTERAIERLTVNLKRTNERLFECAASDGDFHEDYIQNLLEQKDVFSIAITALKQVEAVRAECRNAPNNIPKDIETDAEEYGYRRMAKDILEILEDANNVG